MDPFRYHDWKEEPSKELHISYGEREVFHRPKQVDQVFKPCCFCRKNGERPEVYMTHQLYSMTLEGKRVSCPILRSVKCPICGASGDFAHTLSHCPYSRNRVSVALMLKSTARQGNGSIRKRVD